MNVVDYLLKPVDEVQLNQILEKLCRMTDDRRRREQDMASFRAMQDTSRQEKNKCFWDRLLLPEPEPFLLTRDAAREQYALDLPHELVQLLILSTDLQDTAEMAVFSYAEKLMRNARTAFQGKAVFYCEKRDYGIYILLNYSNEQIKEVRNAVSVFFYNCKEQQENYLEAPLSLGISAAVHMPADLNRRLDEARDAVWGRMVLTGSQIIRSEQLEAFPGAAVEDVLDAGSCRALREAVHHLRREELAELFSRVKAFLAQHGGCHPSVCRRVWQLLHREILAGASEDKREALDRLLQRAAWRSRDAISMLTHVYAVLDDYIREQEQSMASANRRPVEKTIAYIRRNYARDISLESAAEAVDLSPAYLCRIFKDTTQSNFNEYLTQVRMEESKRLLTDTTLPVREIAGAVGYPDEKYFSKVFKKQIGIKPSEYRKLYG